MVIDALNIIKLNRGDCVQIPLFINIGTDEEPVRLDFNRFKDLDIEVYLGVYPPNSKFEHSIIRKKFTYLDVNDLGKEELVNNGATVSFVDFDIQLFASKTSKNKKVLLIS